ncbi:GH116 family glycosyl-hydrolase [Larkinella insperata]|uniref:GH116 family glycosyl-hydrolase n=1 Tax=Larkinella insperata TaxID=332158 RepID=A0ABW3QJZ9_9BACT|nr:GH116 family glycosyl-hydrolase [Larkinella insperata]
MTRSCICVLLAFRLAAQLAMAQWQPAPWPVLKHYDKDHLYNIALPLGGIGTGTVSLGGRGELRDWEIMNKPAKGFSTVTVGNNAPFFAINVRPVNGKPMTKALLGPLDPAEYLHYEGRPVNQHGFPRFTDASFEAAYPLGQVNLSDPKMPVRVRIKGFNPFVPGDADASGIPMAVLAYEVTNTGREPLTVSVCGSMRNFIGKDGSQSRKDWKGDVIPLGAKKNQNRYRAGDGFRGIYMFSDSVDRQDPAWGTLALTTNSPSGVSYRTSSRSNDWENAMLDFWDDFSADGQLTEQDKLVDDDPLASLAVQKTIAPGQTQTYSFFITWSFPNRPAWSSFSLQPGQHTVGNYYATQYANAWEVMTKTLPRLPALEQKTLQFVNAFLASTYPDVIKEAALFNLATLRSQTVFRIPSGHLMGWEGIFDENGSCFGSCTHVWNYEQATAFLFADLSQSMRDIEFNHATSNTGKMSFRVMLPLSKAQDWNNAAADGQMGTVLKLYRDWHLSGNPEFLRRNWEPVKRVMSYAWIPGGWDGNQDGVMEGRQHNTMDVDYFGPNPQMGFWYLGALKATAEMATAMKDKALAQKCLDLYRKGSAWMDQHLFNGEYYEHKITDPKTFAFLDWENNPNVAVPDYQLGKGCLVDQLVGQMMAHMLGLGYLAKPENIQKTLQSVMKYNYLDNFSDHFNNMRSYVMGDEAGLLMASWPKGRLKVPFPYFAESMTGFEYTAAVGMLYEGQTENALKCLKSIRDRFDGRKRNPFNEPECGHHYARSMTSWNAVLAWSGFRYSGVTESMALTSRPGTYFWSNGSAWGTCTVAPEGAVNRVSLTVLNGKIRLRQVELQGGGTQRFKQAQEVGEGGKLDFKVL